MDSLFGPDEDREGVVDKPLESTEETAPLEHFDAQYRPIPGAALHPRDKYQQELQQCGKEEGMDDRGRLRNFGEAYLKACGYETGKAIRAGGMVTPYIPRTTGGFAATGTAQHRQDAFDVGSVCILLTTGAAAKIVRCAKDSDAVEVEFEDQSRESVAKKCLRLAGTLERKAFNAAINTTTTKKRDREVHATPPTAVPQSVVDTWVVPGLFVRIVSPLTKHKDVFRQKGYVASVVGAHCTVDVIGKDGAEDPTTQACVSLLHVETLPPKAPSDNAVIVRGGHRGSRVSFVAKGGRESVKVALPGGDIVEVAYDDICITR
jgi:hypothetical protein